MRIFERIRQNKDHFISVAKFNCIESSEIRESVQSITFSLIDHSAFVKGVSDEVDFDLPL